jgi:hypothetical protein
VSLTDTILRLHQARVFSVHWTEKILGEAENALIRDGKKDSVQIKKRFESMRTWFPESMITGYEALIDSMTCDPKDRHVLAAAIGNVDQCVTNNLDDFPEESTAQYGIEVVPPDDLLLNAVYLHPKVVVRVIREQSAALNRPPMSIDDVLNALAKHVPNFAQTVETILRA